MRSRRVITQGVKTLFVLTLSLTTRTKPKKKTSSKKKIVGKIILKARFVKPAQSAASERSPHN